MEDELTDNELIDNELRVLRLLDVAFSTGNKLLTPNDLMIMHNLRERGYIELFGSQSDPYCDIVLTPRGIYAVDNIDD